MYRAIATCAFGLESVLSFELRRLNAQNIETDDGRVKFDADDNMIAEANIWLRTAERVLISVGEFPAPTFDALFDGVKALPWGEFVDRNDAFPVKGFSLKSTLTSIPACQSIVKKAMVERLKIDHNTEFLPERGSTKRIRFSITKDICTIMLDTTGDGLHKRGYRPLLNEAPIKETLAAGLADLARIRSDSHVADPFCGSGTLLIESAQRAAGIAPGLNRRFAAEEYDFLGKELFDTVRAEAREKIDRGVSFRARGFDIDPSAVEIARANAKRAGVEEFITFEVADARKFIPLDDEIILANPPYGERLLDAASSDKLMADFGKQLNGKKYKGLYIISPSENFEKMFGSKANRRRKLYNGMINCQLFMYFDNGR